MIGSERMPGASSEPKCEHEFKMKVFYYECKKCGWLESDV